MTDNNSTNDFGNTGIIKFLKTLKKALLAKDCPDYFLGLSFVKYCIDNQVGVKENVESMKNYISALTNLNSGSIKGLADSFSKIISDIDKEYQFDGILSLYYSDFFSKFEETIGLRNNAGEMASVLRELSAMNLTEEPEDDMREIGIILTACYAGELSAASRAFSGVVGSYSTSSSVSQLASNILDVSKNEVFCDFVCGKGVSTSDIVLGTDVKVVISDIDSSALACSFIQLILLGFKPGNIIGKVEDLFENVNPDCKADKIFVDPPVRSKYFPTEKEPSVTITEKVINSLKENGTAVIVIPSTFLFSEKKQIVECRKNIIDAGILKSVITVPHGYYGTAVSASLLVLSKTGKEKNIYMMDYSSKKNAKGRSEESGFDPDSVYDIYSEREDIFNVSRSVSLNIIAQNGYDISPARYIMSVSDDDDSMTLEEVDEKLKDLYSELFIMQM